MSSITASAEPRSNAAGGDESALVRALVARLKPRAKSLIVTIFGDAILPIGGAVWLGDLIRLAAPLGLAERTVRTAVWRLVQDGTLEAEQIGRRSLYRLTATGRRRFETAQRRIYAVPDRVWDGRWHLVLVPPSVGKPDREGLERELAWLGYAPIAPGVLAHPHGDTVPCDDAIDGLGLAGRVVTLAAETLAGGPAERDLVAAAWPLDDIAERYRGLLAAFVPLGEVPFGQLEAAFAARVLLIHAYRRALLPDPGLPPTLLPDDWPGTAAAAITARLYRLLADTAQRHVLATAGSAADRPARLDDRFMSDRHIS